MIRWDAAQIRFDEAIKAECARYAKTCQRAYKTFRAGVNAARMELRNARPDEDSDEWLTDDDTGANDDQ